ncbi:MAG: hypothetical protein GY741_15500 [Phycisphaeraceae bacterium]|nr:hypothetical protein [Phycisphaeraceae bacterium]
MDSHAAAASIACVFDPELPFALKQEVRAALGEVDHDRVGTSGEQSLIRPTTPVSVRHHDAPTTSVGYAERHLAGAFDHLHDVGSTIVVQIDAGPPVEPVPGRSGIARSSAKLLVADGSPALRKGIGSVGRTTLDRLAAPCSEEAAHGCRDSRGRIIVNGLIDGGGDDDLHREGRDDHDITSSM